MAGRGEAAGVRERAQAPAKGRCPSPRPVALDGEAPPGERSVEGGGDNHGAARVDPVPLARTVLRGARRLAPRREQVRSRDRPNLCAHDTHRVRYEILPFVLPHRFCHQPTRTRRNANLRSLRVSCKKSVSPSRRTDWPPTQAAVRQATPRCRRCPCTRSGSRLAPRTTPTRRPRRWHHDRPLPARRLVRYQARYSSSSSRSSSVRSVKSDVSTATAGFVPSSPGTG